MELIIYIGLDDFDSRYGGCTTHLACKIINFLNSVNCRLIGYPMLIRLNPDVPWKTRGNGAVSLKVSIPNRTSVDYVFREIISLCSEYCQPDINTNSGIVFLLGERIPKSIVNFSKFVITRLVSLSEAFALLSKFRRRVKFWYYGSGYGLIGALAAIGARKLIRDYTFELLVYRPLHLKSRNRNVRYLNINEEGTKTFANIDYETRRLLSTPHGVDPVILGVRGEYPKLLHKALKQGFKLEKTVIEDLKVFKTNQATFMNLEEAEACSIAELNLYTQCCIYGVVVDVKIIDGGHVKLELSDSSSTISVMVYKPSGEMNNLVRNLRVGDVVVVCGGVKPKRGEYTLNTQVIRLMDTYVRVKVTNPICPKCMIPMSSDGKQKGFKCKKCNYHIKYTGIKSILTYNVYMPELLLPPLRSIRHLTKVLPRFGREKCR